jgi:hypothetical protein
MSTATEAKANTDAENAGTLITDGEVTPAAGSVDGNSAVKTEDKAPAKAEASADGKTEVTLKLPEGSLLDAKAVEEISAFAKAQGLTPEKAQALLERESKLVATKADEQKSQWDKVTVGWVDEAKADKEIGG